jgi:Zn-dependent protease
LNFDFQRSLLIFVPLVLSLTVHEFAHAWSAWKLGDDTAARMGRMTLNPLAHVDPIGTVLLPLLGVPFGWAKPVPVDPSRFRREVSMGTGMAITAGAGPISNLLIAVLSAAALGLLVRFAPHESGTAVSLVALTNVTLQLNLNLALFNLIPIPPLDGSRIVDGFLPHALRPQWEWVLRFSPFLLIGVFFFGWRIIGGPSRALGSLLYRLAEVAANG